MADQNAKSEHNVRRIVGRVLGTGIVVAAVIAIAATLLQWDIRPQTDDATVRANFVGIAPQVSGHIVELNVRDNQRVREGDPLFLIDPRPYKITLERARAELARLEAQFQHADDHLNHLEPLLPQHFVTQDRVEEARAQRATALASLSAAEAAVHAAELDLSYCSVRAPFTGLVVNMNISNGAFARAGAEVFTLVDTRTWYVIANFRETQLRRIAAGTPADIYLQSQPFKHFRGTVVGLGWAVLPENGTSVMGLPNVERSLDWIRLAARFPVRIKVDNPDDTFRVGESAVVTVQGK